MRFIEVVPKYIRLPYIFTLIFAILLVLSSFNTSANHSLKFIGLLSLIIILGSSFFILFYFIFKTLKIPKDIAKLTFISILLFSIYIIAIFIDGFSLIGIKIFVQLILVLTFFICMIFINWNEKKLRIINTIVIIFIVANFIVFIASGMPFPFKSFTGNNNVFTALIFFLTFFPLLCYLLQRHRLKKLLYLFLIGISLLLIVFGQARSIWLALVVAFFVYMLWGYLSKNKILFHSFFGLVTLSIFSIIILYPLASSHPDALIWNQFVREYTGANLFSGRNRFWLLLVEVIMQKPVLGHGAGAVPSHFLPITLSSHNLYIQVALQVGLLGLGITWILFFNIWRIFYYGKNNVYVRMAGSFFIAMMVYQVFEVSLTQNNLAVGLIIWLIMAIGVGKSLEERRKYFLKLGD